jgi:hypothetical protein
MSDTSQVKATVDVLSKYSALVKESLGGDSVYIRAKETVEALVASGALDDAQKAEVISSIIGNAVGSVTSSAMASALDWVKYEKELALKKLEMDLQLSIAAQELLLKEAQVDQVKTQNRLALVESKRMFGTATFDINGAITNLTSEGKVFNDMQLVSQQTANAAKEELLLGSKIDESKAAIHKVVADTYTNFGNYTFAYDPSGNGIATVERLDSNHTSLSDTQKEIAVEQGKGYTYNAWANALTGSASILGTALASGDFDFSSGSSGDVLLKTVVNCANNLAVSASTSEEAIPVEKVQVPVAF